MSPVGSNKPEMACICGERFPMGVERCGCGGTTYPVGSNPWADAAEQGRAA